MSLIIVIPLLFLSVLGLLAVWGALRTGVARIGFIELDRDFEPLGYWIGVCVLGLSVVVIVALSFILPQKLSH